MCLEWDDSPLTRNYPFKFNRDWLQVVDFSQLVISSWSSEDNLSDCDDMTNLVMKLKSLDVAVKDWEKLQRAKHDKEADDLEEEIHQLLSRFPSGIFLDVSD